MKRTIIVLLVTFLWLSAQAQNNRSSSVSGYRGYISTGIAFPLSDYSVMDGIRIIYTSHGYRFNQYVYLGAGAGWGGQISSPRAMEEIGYGFDLRSMTVPVFANLKINLLDSKIVPMIDIKSGYVFVSYGGSFTFKNGPFASFSVGCNFGLTKKQCINLLLGYELSNNDFVEEEYVSGYDYHESRRNIYGQVLSVTIEYGF